MMWILASQFRAVLGAYGYTHGDFFIEQRTFFKTQLTKHCVEHADKNCIVLFPEGTQSTRDLRWQLANI